MTTKVTPAVVEQHAGKVLQTQYVETTDFANSLSANIPFDDTIPQNTEGTEWLTVTITPKFSGSKLRVRFTMWGTANNQAKIIAALFRDSGANAIDVTAIMPPFGGQGGQLVMDSIHAAGSTSATTFKVRVGTSNDNLSINGNGANRRYGGAAKSTLIVEELAPAP